MRLAVATSIGNHVFELARLGVEDKDFSFDV